MFLNVLLFCVFVTNVKSYILVEEECLNYTVYPVQYELIITPYILSNERFYYNCDMTITVIANAPGVRVIEMDAKDLEIGRDSVGVWFENRNIIDNRRPFDYDKKAGKIYLYLREDLKQYRVHKNQYHIKISFNKYLNYKDNGIFVSRYNQDSRDRYLLSTRITPNYAKNVFPCFDNPLFEAVFKIKIYIPPQQNGLLYPTSTLVIAQETRRHINRDNYTIIEYMPSPQISTYQMGIHLSNFMSQKKNARFSNDSLIIWAPSKTIHYYSYILDIGAKILDTICKYSGTNRTITNGPINLVGLPKEIRGYEKGSWNLLTNSDYKLTNYIQFTSVKQKEAMTFDLAQQLSRIWLGNPGETERTRWKQEWFKEGMATYFSYYFLAKMGAFWDMRTYGLQIRHKAMNIDSQSNVPALSSFNQTLAVLIPPQYEELVTTKTAALLWMVENWLGSDVFHNSLQYYISSRRGKFISIDDFAEYLQKQSVHCEFFKGFTVADVLNSWIRQPGYPLVSVHVYREDGGQDAVHLEQRHFTYNGISKRDYKYLIPISYITQYTDDCYNCFQPKFTIGNTDYSFKENLNHGWIILNRNASGYYRVNYDTETWKLIVKSLKGPERVKIDPYNRGQIVNDAFALYMAGVIDLQLATDILDCLDYEDSFVVWDAALSGFYLLKIENALNRVSKQSYGYWKMFMREKISSIYSRKTHEFERDHQTRLFKSRIMSFSCSIDHALCIRDLNSEMERIKLGQTYDPDLREACYYKLLNRSHGWDAINGKHRLNRFELEDFVAAEDKAKREVRFVFNLPNSNGPPMALKLSTSTSTEQPSPPLEPDLQTTGSPGRATVNTPACLIVFIITIFIAL